MITNISLLTENTAVAEGPLFDSKRILKACDTIMRGLVAEICMMCPDVQPTWCEAGFPRRPLVQESDYRQLAAFFQSHNDTYDVVDTSVHVNASPFFIAPNPLGNMHLYLERGEEEPTTDLGEPWEMLDPTPSIKVLFRDIETTISKTEGGEETIRLIATGGEVLAACARRCAPDGALIEVDGMLSITFPHEAFGRGNGPLRILLVHK